MKNKLLAVAATALMTLSMGSAQATTLTFNGLYQTTDQVDLFYFDNSSVGDVDIWADTLQDGLWQTAALFKNNGAGDWNWTGDTVKHATEVNGYNPTTGVNDLGVNDFGVAMKNGFVAGDSAQPGISDIGVSITDLDIGSYMIVVSEDFNYTANSVTGSTAGPTWDGTMSRPIPTFLKNWKNQTWSTAAGVDAPFELYVNGAGVAEVSAVPVPAAVWLFTSAMAGLSVVRRKNSKAIA